MMIKRKNNESCESVEEIVSDRQLLLNALESHRTSLRGLRSLFSELYSDLFKVVDNEKDLDSKSEDPKNKILDLIELVNDCGREEQTIRDYFHQFKGLLA